MNHEIESMNSRCFASLRISRSGDRAQLVITTRRQPTTLHILLHLRRDTSQDALGYFRKTDWRRRRADRSYSFVVANPQPFLVPYMQIPIARRIDYPRPDRDRARSRDARAHRNPGQMRDSWAAGAVASPRALAIRLLIPTVSFHRECLRYDVPIIKMHQRRLFCIECAQVDNKIFHSWVNFRHTVSFRRNFNLNLIFHIKNNKLPTEQTSC